ncbi:hypothetical protein GOBAR_AA26160 [Gossypium barbadense]|uniref:Myb-like domain-containing protein n=1 Tax=Gossypium barbadense TaxID=3634 RepID=A0A2P5WTT4_GOSBA|nr:hypothetical protein GOBAR_AA26160 [Gossypium barbadense]
MGFKRPFDDEDLQELPFKNRRQFGYDNKLTRFADTTPHGNSPQKPHISLEVEGGFHKHQWYEEFKSDALNDVAHLVDEDFETSAPLSLVTSTSSEEDISTGVTAISPVSSEYFDFDFPRRTFSPVEDDYYLLLDRSPRKQVPLGPNHQANVPSWGRHIKNIKFAQNEASKAADIDNEDNKMGTCIIPLPDLDLSANSSDKVGAGRFDCSCLDRGSLRCVQQHVTEARKLLRKSLGHEKFVKLGFYNMGEDVAYKWSEEDEEIFREVVYTNPVSLGKKFWKHLSVVFPSRSKRELVSYYFNVFILQRRAVQNRSSSLDIDSDDDELCGNQPSYKVQALEEDEDSAIDSAATREDYGINLPYKGPVTKSFDKSWFDPVFQPMDKVFGTVEDFNVQEDSCMSFEFQPNMVDSHCLVDTKANLYAGGMKTEISQSLQGKLDDSSELVSNVYLLDNYDAKIWDTRYSTTSTKGIDLQPTCNIIEEIFGQET